MYLVYWIPTKIHSFNPRKYTRKFLYQVDINRDTGEWKVNFLFIPNIGKFGKIIIFEETGKDLAILEIIDYNSFGILILREIYSDYRLKDRENTDKFTDTLYHFIKEFWHSHEFHPIDEDTRFRALRIKDCPKMEECINQILEHYANLFYLKFAEADKKYSIKPLEDSYTSFLKNLLSFNELFSLTRKEENLNFLLGESLYFQPFKKFMESKATEHQNWFEIAEVITNLIKSLEKKRDNIVARRNAILNFWTLILAFLGVILGIIGIILSLY